MINCYIALRRGRSILWPRRLSSLGAGPVRDDRASLGNLAAERWLEMRCGKPFSRTRWSGCAESSLYHLLQSKRLQLASHLAGESMLNFDRGCRQSASCEGMRCERLINQRL